VLDEVVEKFSADPSDYIAGTNKVIKASQSVADAQAKHLSLFSKAGTAASGFGAQVASALAPVRSMALAAGAGIAAVAAIGTKAFTEFATFDSLVKALEAVEGGSDRAKKSLADLKQISKQPGLGFGESVEGYLQLRRSELSAGFSKQLVAQAGNANAIGGGTKENLASILRAFSQMAMKPYLQGEELLQLSEAGVGAQGMIKKRFGTADPEELKKQGITSQMALAGILEELKKLPRVAGGAQNTIDNLGDSLRFMMVSVGGAIASFATGPIDAIATAISNATDSGVFVTAIDSFAQAIGLVGENSFNAESAVLGMVAAFMTLGTHIEIFKGNIEGLIEMFRGIAKFLVNAVGPIAARALTSPFFDVEGFAKGKSGLDPAGTGVDFFTMYSQQLEQQMEANRRKKKPKAQADALTEGMAEQKPAQQAPGLKPVDLLQRIANNTDPLKEIATQILGGGTLAQRGFSRQELGDLRAGRTGTPWDRVTDALKKAVIDEAVRLSGFQVSRREI